MERHEAKGGCVVWKINHQQRTRAACQWLGDMIDRGKLLSRERDLQSPERLQWNPYWDFGSSSLVFMHELAEPLAYVVGCVCPQAQGMGER